MNYSLLLAGGVGQRMRTAGLPKQFLEIYGKPIIAYTIEKFETAPSIGKIVIVCHKDWILRIKQIISKYGYTQIAMIVPGGNDRMDSLLNGLKSIRQLGAEDNDIVVIHDAVRPLVDVATIEKNIEVTTKKGNAMTVKSVTETVVVSDGEYVDYADIQQRSRSYSLTSPQTFRLRELEDSLKQIHEINTSNGIPLLDPAMIYARLGKKMYLVKEDNMNIKITTPADFYYLRSILELEESKQILGI